MLSVTHTLCNYSRGSSLATDLQLFPADTFLQTLYRQCCHLEVEILLQPSADEEYEFVPDLDQFQRDQSPVGTVFC
ncbi:hypothetical protein GDO86_020279 [Hymenochirus boettgeri]|uniref:Uncharacterized protein n=1 Tax=Hymenochirus boettgeri TaxID=247094 RepID=A0A8T2IIB6_9PIPI|nr:hypothetical protein GDO86_020279 [Hymenochirus boettgeri]